MALYGRPSTDVTKTNMVGVGSTTNLWDNTDEVTASDTEYSYSTNNVNGTLEHLLTSISPSSAGAHILSYRLAKTNAGTINNAGSAVAAVVSLYQGATLIAASSSTTLSGTWTTGTLTLTSPQIANISNYADLRIRVVITPTATGTASQQRGGGISWAQLQVASADTASVAETATIVETTNGIRVYSAATTETATIAETCNGTISTSVTQENLFNYSEDFNSGSWNRSGSTVTADATTAPDSTTTADKLVENTSSGGHLVNYIFSGVSGETYTESFYVKAGERSSVLLSLYVDGAATGNDVYFSLASGGSIVSQSNTGLATRVGAAIQDVGGGWFRISQTLTLAATANIYIELYMVSSATTWDYVGNGSNGLYIWGAQLNRGIAAATYLKTPASSGTTYAASTSETETLAETQSVLQIRSATQAETSAISEVQSNSVVTNPTVVETANAVDSSSAIQVRVASVLETATIIETQLFTSVITDVVSEVASVSDTSSATKSLAGSTIESFTLIDAIDSLKSLIATLTETSSVVETSNGLRATDASAVDNSVILTVEGSTKDLAATTSENELLSDTELNQLQTNTNQVESSNAIEEQSGLSTASSFFFEGLNLLEQQSVSTVYNVSVEEVLNVQDSAVTTKVTTATIIEIGSISETSDSFGDGEDVVSEIGNIQDISSATRVILVTVIETITVTAQSNFIATGNIIEATVIETLNLVDSDINNNRVKTWNGTEWILIPNVSVQQ